MIAFNHSLRLSKVFFRVRSRILMGYVIVMALFAILPVAGVRQVLFTRIETEAEQDLSHAIEEFRQLVKRRNPKTAKPFGNDVAALFDVFLSRNDVPQKNQFFITLINGKFYKASSNNLPKHLQPNSPALNRWAYITAPKKGRDVYKGSIILYYCQPITFSGSF